MANKNGIFTLFTTLLLYTGTWTVADCQTTFAAKFTRGDVPNTCKSPSVVARCVQKADLDLIFLVDTSDHQQGFDKAKGLIRSVVQCLRISKDETHVSIVRYRNQANIDLPLQTSKPKLLTYLKKMTNGQTTKNTRSFLGKAFSYLSTAISHPKFGSRADKFTVVVLITKSPSADLFLEKRKSLLREGVKIISVVYNDVDPNLLAKSITEDDDDYLITMRRSSELPLAASSVNSAICELSTNYPGIEAALEYDQLKKAFISSISDVKSISLLGPIMVTPIATMAKISWAGANSNLVTDYDLSWTPEHGELVHAQGTKTERVIKGLRPGTAYALEITPIVKMRDSGKSVIIMFSTESNPLENLEVRAETCVESTYEPYLEVQWKEEKDDSIARLSISPPLEEDEAKSEISELSPGFVENHRFFKLVTPGQEYQVEMTKVGIKNVVSVPTMKKVIVPPIEPEEISIGLITQTSVQLKLAAPKTGIFDYFFITISSAFGKTEHNTTMSDKQFGGQFYTMIFDDLLPGAHYKIKTFTVSNGVSSLAAKVDSCFTLSPTKPVLDRNLLLSGTEGLCVLSFLGNEVKCLSNIRSTTPDEIGAVLYYENWEPISKVVNKYMIYAKPKDRKILVTGVDGYPHLTLVGDLDMPFGLALDKYGENLYFTDQWTYSIGVASISAALQGSVKATKQILTSNNGIPRFIAVDPIRRLLYWSTRDGELESVSRSDLNGKRQRMIWFSLGDTDIEGLSIDLKTGNICWRNAKKNRVEKIDSNGDNFEIMAEDIASKALWRVFSSALSDENMLSISQTLGKIGEISWVDYYNAPDYAEMMVKLKPNLDFPCATGLCQDDVCIPDNDDDEYCSKSCHIWEEMCPTSKQCIPKEYFCDGFVDCQYGEDEDFAFLGFECPNKQKCEKDDDFVCDVTKRCISKNLLCDGKFDCRDGSDEENCIDASSNCTFQDGLCSWSFGEFQDNWKLTDKPSPSDETGPYLVEDSNRYLLFEASEIDENEESEVISGTFKNAVCLSFNYMMNGAQMGKIKVERRDELDSLESLVWEKTGDHGQSWIETEISIVPSNGMFRIVISAVRGRTFASDIAIDDIKVKNGICKAKTKCTFGRGEDCGLQFPKVDESYFVWKKDFAKIIPPRLSKTNSIVSPDWQTGTIDDSDWRVFDFNEDNVDVCAGCGTGKNPKFIKRHNSVWIGVVRCPDDPDEYKIYISDSREGLYRHIQFPHHTDICEVLGGRANVRSYAVTVFCPVELAYKQVADGSFREVNTFANSYTKDKGFRTVKSYKCLDTNVPELQASAEEYSYFIASTWGMGSKRPRMALFTWPVHQPAAASDPTESASSWCLRFSYSIIFTPELVVNMNGNLLWSSDGISTGEFREHVAINIPKPIVGYDLTFIAIMPSRKSGAALVDEISIDQKSCFVRQNKCDFSTIADIENCFFHLNEGALTIEHHHRLYEKSPFDPELLAPVLKPGYTITLKSENQWNAIYESDQFFIGKPFYDEYCVLFRYRQRVSGEIKVNLLIDGYEKALFHKFERPNPHKIYPWVDVAIDVKLDDEKYPLGAMAKIQYKGLYETYLARIELQNGACPATNCNGKLSCVSDRTQCVEPYQLCDTDNDCDDWSDEMGCASGCGDQSEHFETKSSLGAKPGRSSCLWRIHGRQGKKIAVKVMMFGDLDQIKFMTMFEGLKTLDSYYGGVSVDLEEGTNGTVVKEYLLNSNEATIIVDFNLVLITADGQINAMPLISYEQVDDSYCSFVCKNSECLHDNYQCDGNPGCLAEDDELDCVRENQVDGLNIAEVRQIDGSWAQVCADENFTRHIANRLCYQMGFWAASSFNYGNIVSPYYNDFVVALPDEQETKGDSWVQGMLVKGTCPSRRVWSVDCGSYACGKRQVNTRPVTRIVGGSKTYLGKWPWMVSFQIRNVHNCGGAIISDSLILTAGHCFDKNLPKVHTILVGGNNHKSPEIVRRGIKQAHIHPEYYPDSNVPNHDIAIVQLDRKVSFSKYLQPICLPTLKYIHGPGSLCHLAGWGKLSKNNVNGFPSIMYDVSSPIIPNAKCGVGEYSHVDFARNGSPITDNQLCSGKMDTGGVGICHGDSGGPLMCENNGTFYLTGIVSWSSGCAEKNAPDVLTRVDQYLDWIVETTSFQTDTEAAVTSRRLERTVCKGSVIARGQGGLVQSEGWPKEYGPNIDCTVKILKNSARMIELSPLYFALPNEEVRSKVRIYAGSVEPENLVQTFSGIGHFDDAAFSEKLYVNDSDVTIRFTSGNNKLWHIWAGFQIEYRLLDKLPLESEQIQIESQCGGILLDHPFYFEWGPSIENSQENKCLWTIQEADDGFITLVDFMEFDIPADVGIFNIYLDKLLPNNFYASYSGSSLPPVIETSSQIIIQFIGLAEVEAYFRLDIAYERRRSHTLASDVVGSCGGKLTAASGYIASPSWPSPYPGDQECIWMIDAKAHQRVVLEFETLDLEFEYDDFDVTDSLGTIRIGREYAPGLQMYGAPEPVFDGAVTIHFLTDADISYTNKHLGFLLYYRVEDYVIDNSEVFDSSFIFSTSTDAPTTSSVLPTDLIPSYNATCPYTSNIRNGVLVLKSPGFPNGYPTNADCIWEIGISNDALMMELDVKQFHVEESNECQFDSLSISEGNNGWGMKLCGALGKEVPSRLEVRSTEARLHFSSDNVHGYEGFEIHVLLIPRPPTTPMPANVLFTCNFDFDMCEFHNGIGNTAEWIRMRDGTPSSETGPPYDVSLTGYYIYFEATDKNEGSLGRVFTPTIDYFGEADNVNLDLDPHCIQFYFDMYGSDMGTLRLFLVNEEYEGRRKSLLWEQKGQQRVDEEEEPWEQVSLTFYPYTKFNLVWEAEAGAGYRSDMALDQIQISQGKCRDCTGDGLFDCKDDSFTCILAEFTCDGYSDCPNSADEKNCLSKDAAAIYEDVCEDPSLKNLAACRNDNYVNFCDGEEEQKLCDGKWDCRYGADEAGCSTETESPVCGLPDPEPRSMGWAIGRARFMNVQYRWAWTASLHFNSKFECSVHMVAKDWYLTSARCVEKGVSKTKSKTSWMAYGGCHVESEDDYVVSVSSSSFSIEHFSVQGELVIQRVMQIILHNSDLEDHGNMALIGIESSENLMQYPVCFDFDETHRFDFSLDKPHLCQLVGHRRDLLGDAFTKWQSMVPVKSDEKDILKAGYRMLLVQPFHDDQGTGLFCQSWNQKWHLVGITQPNDGDIEGRSATWPSMRAGLNVVSDIQGLTKWVQQECPGQFLCKKDRVCIDRKSICNGEIDCSDGTDERECDSGCGSGSWIQEAGTTVSVSSFVTKCRWIIPSSPGSINLIRLDKLVSDRKYKVATYDSVNHTWLVYKNVPKFFSSSPGGTLTLQIEMEAQNSLLDLRFVALREELASDGEYPCEEQFKCKSTGARGVFCISPELVCNGVNDCADGEDEENCEDILECGSPKFQTALATPKFLFSQNHPLTWTGQGKCIYKIDSFTGDPITLDFEEFNSDVSDVVKIYAGFGCSKRQIGEHFGDQPYLLNTKETSLSIEWNFTDNIHLRSYALKFFTK